MKIKNLEHFEDKTSIRIIQRYLKNDPEIEMVLVLDKSIKLGTFAGRMQRGNSKDCEYLKELHKQKKVTFFKNDLRAKYDPADQVVVIRLLPYYIIQLTGERHIWNT